MKGLSVMVMMLEQFQFVSHVIKWMSISTVTPELQEKVATSYRALDGRVTDMDHTSIEEHLTILEKVGGSTATCIPDCIHSSVVLPR